MPMQKYVVFDDGMLEVMVVFPDYIDHSTIKWGSAKPVSAGFISVRAVNDTLEIDCAGRSMGLNLVSRREVDEKLAKRQLYPQRG